MTLTPPTGHDRVLKYVSRVQLWQSRVTRYSTLPLSSHQQARLLRAQEHVRKNKQKLVALSLRARDKVTRFYASNALKELAQK